MKPNVISCDAATRAGSAALERDAAAWRDARCHLAQCRSQCFRGGCATRTGIAALGGDEAAHRAAHGHLVHCCNQLRKGETLSIQSRQSSSLEETRERSLHPNLISETCAISACGTASRPEQILLLLEEIQRRPGVVLDVIAYKMLQLVLAQSGAASFGMVALGRDAGGRP
jgi:hypothetical protein